MITYNIIDEYKNDINNLDLSKIINYKLYKIIVEMESSNLKNMNCD